jgi:hypothetical protein
MRHEAKLLVVAALAALLGFAPPAVAQQQGQQGVVGLTNETFVQFVTAQAGSSNVVNPGVLSVVNCNGGGTSFDPVKNVVNVDANDRPIQAVYFEWTGGTGYENLLGVCSVTNSGQTQSFQFGIPIVFEQSGNANKIPVTAYTLTNAQTIPEQCEFTTFFGVINSQTPSLFSKQENLQVYAMTNPSQGGLAADQIPAVGVDIQGFYNGFTVNKWAVGSEGCCGGGPFLVRVMCSTLAHFQTNS